MVRNHRALDVFEGLVDILVWADLLKSEVLNLGVVLESIAFWSRFSSCRYSSSRELLEMVTVSELLKRTSLEKEPRTQVGS